MCVCVCVCVCVCDSVCACVCERERERGEGFMYMHMSCSQGAWNGVRACVVYHRSCTCASVALTSLTDLSTSSQSFNGFLPSSLS